MLGPMKGKSKAIGSFADLGVRAASASQRPGRQRETRTPQQIIEDIRQLLQSARLGRADVLAADPSKRMTGLMNVVTFGRAVLNALPRLKRVVVGYDDWFQTHVPADDPLLKYFIGLRDALEHEGRTPRIQTQIFAHRLSMRDLGPRPPGAVRGFIGDSNGGSGWMIALPDGTQVPYYVSLPESAATVTIHFPEAPTEHLGEPIGSNVETQVTRYVQFLEALVNAAEARFG